jgi:polyisoprenyl-phosphate glycosyltransferase
MPTKRRLTSLAVIVPFYNEAKGARLFYGRLRDELAALNLQCSFVFVDDGSEDETLLVLNTLAEEDPRITALSLARNWGHQVALTAGLDHVDEGADAIVTMDGDLQHPPETIAAMVREYESGAEIVYGIRDKYNDVGRLTRMASWCFHRVVNWSTNVQMVPGAADFRLMSRRAVEVLKGMREVHRFLRGMVPWTGLHYAVVHYPQAPRCAGRPAYTWRRRIRLAQNGLFSFSTLPLNVITWLGFASACAALAYLAYVLLVAAYGHVVPGWSSVIAVILTVATFQFVAMSILAQYLGMLFQEAKRRPLYVLKQSRIAPPAHSVRTHFRRVPDASLSAVKAGVQVDPGRSDELRHAVSGAPRGSG